VRVCASYPKSIQRVIERFSRFPTVGPRTAARFVFYLLKLSDLEFQEFLGELQSLRSQTRLCQFCFVPFDNANGDQNETLCEICRDATREKILCIVEKESDLEVLEKAKIYRGVYFILGGTVGSLRQEDIRKLRIQELQARLMSPQEYGFSGKAFDEIILAMNATTEGESTVLYLERMLKSSPMRITRLGHGIPMGGELEYADSDTLRSALDGRK